MEDDSKIYLEIFSLDTDFHAKRYPWKWLIDYGL